MWSSADAISCARAVALQRERELVIIRVGGGVSLFRLRTGRDSKTADEFLRIVSPEVPIAQVQGEVALARHLGAHGIPVTEPLADAFSVKAASATLWRFVPHSAPSVDAVRGGRLLATLHAAPPLVGGAQFDPIELARQMYLQFGDEEWLTAEDRAFIERLIDEYEPLWHECLAGYDPAKFVTVHGDYHLGNVMAVESTTGGVIHDFERSAAGPREYDVLRIAQADQRFGRNDFATFARAYTERAEANGAETASPLNWSLAQRMLPLADVVAALGLGTHDQSPPTQREIRLRLTSIRDRTNSPLWTPLSQLRSRESSRSQRG